MGAGAYGGWEAQSACLACERLWGRKAKYPNQSLMVVIQLPPTHKGPYLVYIKLCIVSWVNEHLNHNLGISYNGKWGFTLNECRLNQFLGVVKQSSLFLSMNFECPPNLSTFDREIMPQIWFIKASKWKTAIDKSWEPLGTLYLRQCQEKKNYYEKKPFFRSTHLIKNLGRLIILLILCMQTLVEGMQLFGSRIRLEVIKKRSHSGGSTVEIIVLPVSWLGSSQSPGARFSKKLQHSVCTDTIPKERRKLPRAAY